MTPSLGIASVRDFIRAAKETPGKFKYASSGIGASPHLTMELFKSMAGIDVVHVPYKNAAQGVTDVIGGQLHASFFNLPGALPNVKAGRLRALAVTSARRAEQLPDVPDFEVTVWQGYAVPKGTPKPHAAKIHAAMMKALAVPDLQQRFVDNGVAAAPVTPEEFVKFVNVEIAKWQKAVTISGAKVE